MELVALVVVGIVIIVVANVVLAVARVCFIRQADRVPRLSVAQRVLNLI